MNIKRFIAPILIAGAIAMMFTGWIRYDEDETVMDEISEFVDELDEEFDFSKEKEKELDGYFEEADIDLTCEEIHKATKSVTSLFDDGTIAPSDIPFKFAGLVKMCKKIVKAADEDGNLYHCLNFVANDIEALEDFIKLIGVFNIIFWITIIIFVLFAAMSALETKAGIIVTGIIAMLDSIVWYGFAGIITLGLKEDYSISLTVFPLIMQILLIAGFIAALVITKLDAKKKVEDKNVNESIYQPVQEETYTQPQQEYIQPEPQQEYIQPEPQQVYIEPVAQDANADIPQMKYCSSCGAQIKATVKFCTKCGSQQ